MSLSLFIPDAVSLIQTAPFITVMQAKLTSRCFSRYASWGRHSFITHSCTISHNIRVLFCACPDAVCCMSYWCQTCLLAAMYDLETLRTSRGERPNLLFNSGDAPACFAERLSGYILISLADTHLKKQLGNFPVAPECSPVQWVVPILQPTCKPNDLCVTRGLIIIYVRASLNCTFAFLIVSVACTANNENKSSATWIRMVPVRELSFWSGYWGRWKTLLSSNWTLWCRPVTQQHCHQRCIISRFERIISL